MLDADAAAQLWLEGHEPEEWQQLLADRGTRASLSDDMLQWLRASSPELRMQLDDLTGRHAPALSDALARFQQAFLENVAEAAGRRGKP